VSEASRWKKSIVGHADVDPRTLVGHPRNPKIHPPEQDEVVDASLVRLGWVKSVQVNEVTGHVLDGHERLELALRYGEATVPVEYVRVPEELEGLALITLDQSAGLAQTHLERWAALHREAQQETDDESLLTMWQRCAAQQPVGAPAPGSGAGEARAVVQDDTDETEALMAAADEVQQRWQVARGDVWALGAAHRVLCGDSRDARLIARLMQGDRAQAVVTDPIYGQRQPGVPHDEDDVSAVAQAAARVLPGDDLLCAVFQSPRQLLGWATALQASGFAFERLLWMYKAAQCTYPWRGWLLKSEAIIVASRGAPAWQDVHPYAHDCYYLHEVKGELPEGVGWHGSVKPMSVVADLVQRLCPPHGVVFDGFLGSGTTLLACEQTGRQCRAVDLEPSCIAVTLERYQRATGQQPTRVT